MRGGPLRKNRLLLLVGPKGAGKTFIGGVLEKRLGVRFLRVEPIFLENLQREPKLEGIDLDRRGFRTVLERLDELAASHPVLCIESTGTADWFPEYLAALRQRFHVLLIRVWTPLDICLQRIQARDASVHIPVSDDRVKEINERASKVDLPWDLEIDNSAFRDESRLVQTVSEIL
jgi:shikimate kinase